MPFRIAINMAGAVSAGAYTAGVLDFLVEALDAWYAARDKHQQLNSDIEAWDIPAHDISLEVLSGASAGGMCAAISSVALMEKFDHVRTSNPAASSPVNRLYQSWVRSIDILPLLGTDDIPKKEGPVRSLLDSSPIDKIASVALTPDPTRLMARPWLAEQMGVILTLSNLRGVPYSVDKANSADDPNKPDESSFEERINFHADRIEFRLAGKDAQNTPTVRALNYSDPTAANWGDLRIAAMATGAFPIMLAARAIRRTRVEYEERTWNVSNTEPISGECECATKIPPDWDEKVVGDSFDNVYADGGVTNNNPFECAREYLVSKAGNPNGHNPRKPEEANAAVISVAPFPGDEPFDKNYQAQKQSELWAVASALIGTLVSQSRFQGEELKLTGDVNVSSRFAIAPSDDQAPKLPALMCGALGAFGGFIEQKFRDRDYQLGRRNCQQFLRVHLLLPEANLTIAAGVKKRPEILDAFRAEFGLLKPDGNWWYPLIPLMPELRAPITIPTRDTFKTTPARLNQVADAATERLQVVLRALLNAPGTKNGGLNFLMAAIFDFGGKGKLRGAILKTLTSELQALGQV